MLDIYFDKNYGELYEDKENGKCIVFEFESEYGKVRNVFIKREIPISLCDEKKYFDIVTPYGYGGPVIIECNCDRQKLVNEYMQSFGQYCKNENIVSEFVRFHPLINNANDFRKVMQIEDIRYTVGTNLKISDNPISLEFSKSCRKNIRHSLKNGVSYTVEENPDNIQDFIEFYYKTMDRNYANEYYYFDKKYFDNLVKYFKENLVCVKVFYNGVLIAMNICFVYGEYVHIHLSGSITEYLDKRPTYILRYGICEWAHKNGYKYIHHGGGRTNSKDDKLLLFKKQFGKNTLFQFSIGKKIWNEDAYKALTVISKNEVEDYSFFPAYRRQL
ncbi:GNAT family N-acetyltransferase [Clostridium perfringens]|uniref:GNAT family N-acetyltransferase n=1 Tax=Clostridium perfringens TaxID=1502 RepID=UPI0018E4B870|nr:GNAT family N-acetyltransferase [Clostridium perfringens]MBI5995326.1 GNAT family N-acetyltransferase [Clostridium perfringens]MDZ4964576.1 GNAT family N-acetyltransferase [Clostridium perfringens]MDZ5013100.1 GNAT family N-acetyltransferase [Clostridium perfringens]